MQEILDRRKIEAVEDPLEEEEDLTAEEESEEGGS
jgi:hypothetical protein